MRRASAGKAAGISIIVALGFWALYAVLPSVPMVAQSEITIEEGIRRIPDIFSENEIIYYSYDDVPDIPDRQAPIAALELALRTWEEYNPGVRFVHHEWSDTRIEWRMHGAATHSGLATCQSTAIKDRCVLEIAVGGMGCSDVYIQAEHYLLANLIMHELGHSLGIGHSAKEGHLMYSTEDPESLLDARGYVIPPKYDDLESQVAELDRTIRAEQAGYDELYKQYEPYAGRPLSESEYQESIGIYSQLEPELLRINAIVDKYNEMVERLNSLSAVIPCPGR
ncbi:MAG: hypothetical protein EB830_06790 [Nitrosopumilus sp. H13]|nr:MAG: hypothetical protein EB830_06790 [Nitrosopumilus sp. H13]